ncbi:PQQ-dependent sugar dehydrogenase [Streptomyces sp. MP131-18]|uniref:PQQ-dependent sugar dehydrogenase n=1 Tax=Streptomyces sp. MP131-18 TaxID=1857892 RepID=UPI00097C59BE|nr:PQQ-dependent sugar dehydrogenase [Streptomyces sp. MP131-18]ONK09907.1 Soluble aldose sugar dehydrogenase YliI precursor [Streptomyces sp. MP131-18]
MPRRRTGRLLAALALTVPIPLALTGWTAGASDDPGQEPPARAAALPLEELAASATQVASGLARPTAVAAPDDGSGRLFITEKAGTVRAYDPEGGLAAEPLLDIGDRVDNSGNERGLLGIATPPDFAGSGQVYLAYTALPDGAVTLARHDLADGGHEVLLTQEHAQYANHNGGQLAFGSDGHLYFGIGDGGGAGDPAGNGQRTDTLLGKILRLDVSATCGELAYCIPEDNPLAGVEGARGEIWSYGLRNPWRFSFDPADGSLWIGDVGQGGQEEIDHIGADEGGANFGWSCREGLEEFNPDQCAPDAELTDPVFTYPTSVEGCAVIGGHVYRGAEFADLAEGTYVATDYCSNTVWGLRQAEDGSYESATIGEFPTQVTAFGATPEGELYVVNDLPGGLHRVTFSAAGAEG